MHIATEEKSRLNSIQRLKQDPHIAIKTEVPGLVWRIQYAEGYNPETEKVKGGTVVRPAARKSGFMRLLKNLLP